jgi:hypothetical protein
MKTIQTLFIVTLLFSLTASSQITGGNWMVGGSGRFVSNSIKTTIKADNTTQTLSGKVLILQPNIGYFLADKFAVGLSPTFGVNFLADFTETYYSVGGFSRYYLLKSDKLINVLTQIEYSYSPRLNGRSSSEDLGFKAGPVLYFNNSVALELTLNYNIVKYDDDFATSKYNTIIVGIGFQIHLEKK